MSAYIFIDPPREKEALQSVKIPVLGEDSPVEQTPFDISTVDEADTPTLSRSEMLPIERERMLRLQVARKAAPGLSELERAALVNARKPFSQKAREAAESSFVNGTIELRHRAYPVLKDSGIPVDAVLGQIQSSDAFAEVEKELEPIFSSSDLHASMTFAAELMFVRK